VRTAKNSTTGIITKTETEGNKADCSSIYFACFGEKEHVTFATNKGFDVRNLGAVATKLLTLCEMDVDMEVLNPKSIYRLGGIRLDATSN